MKAATYTEVYRPYKGTLIAGWLTFWAIAQSAIRQGFKAKLPLLLLFSPVAIGCIIACFRVHFMFSLSSGDLDQMADPGAAAMGQLIAGVLGDVVDNIFTYLQITSFFMLLAVTWYGAGMISNDRRVGAHLLYFARPLSRFEYLLGKLCALSVFGSLAFTLPCLVVCLIACFSSPEWSFLTEEWGTILKVFVFTFLWHLTLALVVLAVSSLVERKIHALLGLVCLIAVFDGASKILARLLDDNRYTLFSLSENFQRLGEGLFDRWDPAREVSLEGTVLALVAVWLACILILADRLRRMEVVD